MTRLKSSLGIQFITISILLLLTAGCLIEPGDRKPRTTMFIGIDASGSFKHSGYYDNALKFVAHYIYTHLNGLGGTLQPQALFIGSVGGRTSNEPKTFHPIHDFEGKDVQQIEADLRTWFSPDDTLTDFNSFFEEVARITKDRNLILSPITILVVSDGVPDFTASKKARRGSKKGLYKQVNLRPLEYLSRNITLRLTYVSPMVGKHWRTQVPRKRVRLWTVDAEVMKRWPDYMDSGTDIAQQERFLDWLKDNVDFRVRARRV